MLFSFYFKTQNTFDHDDQFQPQIHYQYQDIFTSTKGNNFYVCTKVNTHVLNTKEKKN